MRKIIALLLSVWLIAPPNLVGTTRRLPDDAAEGLIQKSFLELLELETIQTLSPSEIKAVEAALKKEKEAEQARLRKDLRLDTSAGRSQEASRRTYKETGRGREDASEPPRTSTGMSASAVA